MKDEITLLDEVMKRIPNKYMATIVTAKRAKRLNFNEKPLVKVEASKPTTIALHEIAEGLIEPSIEGSEKIDEILLMDSDSDEIIPATELAIDEMEDDLTKSDENVIGDEDDEEEDDEDDESDSEYSEDDEDMDIDLGDAIFDEDEEEDDDEDEEDL